MNSLRMCNPSYEMASNNKCPLESARESLLNLFDSFEKVMLQVQYHREFPAFSHLNHCDRFSHYCASLADEKRSRKNYTNIPLPPECRPAGMVLQRSFLATLTVLLLMKTLKMSWYGSQKPMTIIMQSRVLKL